MNVQSCYQRPGDCAILYNNCPSILEPSADSERSQLVVNVRKPHLVYRLECRTEKVTVIESSIIDGVRKPDPGIYHSSLYRCTATPSAAPTGTLRSTTPRTWSAKRATARCHSAAICSATPSAALTATLRSRTPTRCCATKKSVQCLSAVKRSARTTHAPTTTFPWMALRTSCALPPGAPTTCAANSVSLVRIWIGEVCLTHIRSVPISMIAQCIFARDIETIYSHNNMTIFSLLALLQVLCQAVSNLTAPQQR